MRVPSVAVEPCDILSYRDGRPPVQRRMGPMRIVEVLEGCLGAQLAISVNNCPPPRDPRSRMTSFKRVWISLGLRAKGHDLLTISACEVRPKPGQPVALVEGA